MNTALIFAGGTGQRMNSKAKPKQFLLMHGKPVILYTIEHFEYHEEIDNIVVICLQEYISELEDILEKNRISKVVKIVPGGATGHESIFKGLEELKSMQEENHIVLIHDGVRPLINKELITNNIASVKKYGNGITVEHMRESVIRSEDGLVLNDVLPREQIFVAKAPQSFYLDDIYALHTKAIRDNIVTTDSSHLCGIYHVKMHLVNSNKHNIKITEPVDYYIYKALFDAIEAQQIDGI